MQYVRDELFHFLEQSPHFYKKSPITYTRLDYKESLDSSQSATHIIYTFFNQERSEQAVAEIHIPIKDPSADVKWKFIQMNDNIKKPLFQSENPNIDNIPTWFANLIIKSQQIYNQKVYLLRAFAPNI